MHSVKFDDFYGYFQAPPASPLPVILGLTSIGLLIMGFFAYNYFKKYRCSYWYKRKKILKDISLDIHFSAQQLLELTKICIKEKKFQVRQIHSLTYCEVVNDIIKHAQINDEQCRKLRSITAQLQEVIFGKSVISYEQLKTYRSELIALLDSINLNKKL